MASTGQQQPNLVSPAPSPPAIPLTSLPPSAHSLSPTGVQPASTSSTNQLLAGSHLGSSLAQHALVASTGSAGFAHSSANQRPPVPGPPSTSGISNAAPHAQTPSRRAVVPGSPAFKIYRTFLQRCRRRKPSDPPEEWLSAWLRPWNLIALFVGTCVLIGFIAWLTTWSRGSQGFLTVDHLSDGKLFFGIRLGKSLLWTFLPVLIIQAYALWLGRTISTLADRQPYVELHNPNTPAEARRSILLDYRPMSMFSNWFIAFKRGHVLLGICFLFSTVTTLAVTPFAAHLFLVDSNVRFQKALQLRRTTFFDQWNIGFRTDLLPVLDYVTGVKLYGATYPAWTDRLRSYARFEVPQGSTAPSGTNLSATIHATSMTLDCHALEAGREWTLESQGGASWFVEGNDRGCNFSTYFSHSGIFEYYAQTFSQDDCSYTFPSSDGRILLFAAYAFNGNFTADSDFHLISCTSTYENITGDLNLSFVNSGVEVVPSLHNFDVSERVAMDPRPQFWKYFERTITSSTTIDATTTYSTTVLGRLILALLPQGADSRYLLSAERLSSLMQSTITSIYAVTASAHFNQPLPATNRPAISATATTVKSRLRTSAPIAWTMVGIFCGIAVLIVFILLYTLRHPSILYEEPMRLLGAATLLAGSLHISRTVAGLRNNVSDGRWIKAYTMGSQTSSTEYRTVRWTVEGGDNPKQMVIVRARLPAPSFARFYAMIIVQGSIHHISGHISWCAIVRCGYPIPNDKNAERNVRCSVSALLDLRLLKRPPLQLVSLRTVVQ